ncbi:MAG: hypothetical protein HKN03_16705 [Acidimicrobiales bacterium]|nr:hypothetical protein [Acidimicrobiales bacterium]
MSGYRRSEVMFTALLVVLAGSLLFLGFTRDRSGGASDETVIDAEPTVMGTSTSSSLVSVTAATPAPTTTPPTTQAATTTEATATTIEVTTTTEATTTTAAPTTAAPATTARPTTRKPTTTRRPTTTKKPTTTAPPPTQPVRTFAPPTWTVGP